MAIDIGDAVLTVLIDQAQANVQLEQFGASVPAKIAPATAAFTGTTATVKEMSHEMAVGQQGAVELGKVMNLAGEEARESMYQARGEIGLIKDAFGIDLPRHVRSFIAELPGVGTALSAAFQATAVLFIIGAIAQLVEKIIEFTNVQKDIDEAWKKVRESEEKALVGAENDLLRTMIKVDDLTGNHLEALRLKLELIDRTTLTKLRDEFTKLEQTADKAFIQLDRHRDWFTRLFGDRFEGAEEAKNKFDAMGEAIDKALATRTPDAFDKAIKVIDSTVGDANSKLGEFNQKQLQMLKDFGITAEANAKSKNPMNAVDPRTVQAWNEIIDRAKVYKEIISDEKMADQLAKVDAAIGKLKEQQTELEGQAKRTLEARLLQIDQTRTAELTAFNAGKISAEQWAQANIKATDDAANAHIRYKESLADIARKTDATAQALRQGSIDVQQWTNAQKDLAGASKAAAAAQDAHNEKLKQWGNISKVAEEGLRKAQAETAKLRENMEKLALAMPVEKAKDQTQAFKELEAAEKKLADAQKELALAETGGDFKEQEAAIKRLAQFRILSKQQESALLASMERAEAATELQILKTDLADKEKALNAAKTKFLAASKDALFPPTELAQLKTKLDLAQVEWDKAQTKILRNQHVNNDKLLALDRSHYGQSLALAIATGNKLLAEKLKENHAALLSAQGELADAKAKGINTKATNDQIKALEHLIATLKKEETQLENNAKKGLSAWKQFGAGFRAEAQSDIKTMEEMGKEMKKDLEEFAADIGQEFAAMLQGQESFGEAMAHATEKLIGKMAQQWGEYFAAKAIADIFTNPALGAAEFAAAAALFTVGSLMSSLASDSGGKSGSAASAGTPAPAAGSTGSAAGQQPAHTINVVHLASGGLVDRPTLAVVGDSSSGGRSREAVIPLDNRAALSAIAGAISAHLGSQQIAIQLHSDIPALAKVLSRKVDKGEIRLLASNSIRVTRRS